MVHENQETNDGKSSYKRDVRDEPNNEYTCLVRMREQLPGLTAQLRR